MAVLNRFFTWLWYRSYRLAKVFLPLSALFSLISQWRKRRYLSGASNVYRAPVPVVVVGNISVGGTGKTPLTLWLIEQLREHGYTPGVVSRGYGGNAPYYPYRVNGSDVAALVGDEPLMMHLRSQVPVVVAPDRAAAIKMMLAQTDVDVVISDDGLQHYSMGRSIELVVADGKRGFGNGFLIPAGPLRESANRLIDVDALIINGKNEHRSLLSGVMVPNRLRQFRMSIQASELIPINSRSEPVLKKGNIGPIQAVCGIGNPERFFRSLDQVGLLYTPHVFSDHHEYTEQDIHSFKQMFVVTTEKDAVKLRHFDGLLGAYLPVHARIQDGLIDVILARLESFKKNPHYRY